jgi:hypothetical protein
VRSLIASIDAELSALQRESFSYFEHEVNPSNGLIKDKTADHWPASIAATGFALAAYPIAVERFHLPRFSHGTDSDDATVFLGKSARTGARRDGASGLLLSFS